MLKQFAATLALFILIAAPATAAEQSVDPLDNGQVSFVMPSGNIGCLFTPAGGTDTYQPAGGGAELICERVVPSYVTVVLGSEGEPTLIEDPGEQSCCGAENVFEYGNTLTLDAFECAAETTGLTCLRDDGTGFTMARAGVSLIYDDEGEDDDDRDDDDGDNEDEDDASVK